MSVKVILEAIRALSPEERAQVRASLDISSDYTLSLEEGAQARLRAAGLLSETRQPPTTGRARNTPVEIKGKPLSRTIVDERR
jgi:hypothetical protein